MFFPLPLRIVVAVFLLSWGLLIWRGWVEVDIGAEDALDMLYLEPARGGFFQAESRPANPDFQ